MTSCGDAKEWISATIHGAVVGLLALEYLFQGKPIAERSRKTLKIVYPVMMMFHVFSTIEHTYRQIHRA